jgi:N-acetylglutamate synthase
MADSGVTGRVNAIAPIAFDGSDLDAAIAEAIAWLAARGVHPSFRIADGACAPAHLTDVLHARGWRPHTETLVMTAPIAAALTRLGTPAHKVTLTPDYAPSIDAVLRETVPDPAEYAERAGIAQRTPQPRRFAAIERTGETAAIGMSVVTGAWAAILLMRTHGAHRRQGLAQSIVSSLLLWAQTEGARDAYLQVEATNAPAISLYARAGFMTAYAYRYWRAPAAR